MSQKPMKYNNIQAALHWLVAVLVVLMLFMGSVVLAQTPNTDPAKLAALRGHMVIGVAVFVLTVLRIVWRKASRQPDHKASRQPDHKASRQPDHAETANVLLDKLGIAAHFALNILVLLVAVSGIGIALQAGLPTIVFGGEGSLPPDLSIYAPRIVHGILTKLLIALVALHVAGALYHQFFLKDRLFRRVWFGGTDTKST